MKKLFSACFCILLIIISHNAAALEFVFQSKKLQDNESREKDSNETELIDWDIDSFDSIFDIPWTEESEEENPVDAPSMLSAVKKRGLFASASYEFQGSFAPGWDQRPWEFNENKQFTWGQGVKMTSKITIDAQISEYFRAITTLSYSIPNFYFSLGDFFLDYNIYNYVFLRAGKFEHSWGITSFTNLLTRVPEGSSGPSYIIKADVPIGVGGLQLLVLTRANIANGKFPERTDIGYGGKYNLAFRWLDIDTGIFFQETMPLRAFLSFKTTLWNTEIYNEWLLAVNTHTDNKASFSTNLGFLRDFWNGKITIGGEFYYNGEDATYFYSPETSIREAETVLFADLFKLSFNFIYRFGGFGEPRVFLAVNYLPAQASAQIIPGFRITPISNIEIYLALPFSLGSKDSYYYNHTADPFNRPFSIMLYVTFSGSVRVGYYY